MATKDSIKDLSTITTIPYFTLQNIFDKMSDIIAYDAHESFVNRDSVSEIDIGIGTLNILVDSDEIRYKFIPSNSLRDSVYDAVVNNQVSLLSNIEEAVSKRVMNAYKELF